MNHIVRLALDRSVRSYDTDGRLRVETATITRACVSPYMGAEIVDYDKLGLAPSKVYQVLRPASELQRALNNFNGLPILTRHEPVSADGYRPDLVVGSTGSNAALVYGAVTNSLTIWASPGIDLIETGAARSLSCGYGYRPVVRSGSFEGVPYDLIMTDIQPNHVALVFEPRVAGAMVGDAMPKSLKRRVKMSASNTAETGEWDATVVFANLMDYLKDLLTEEQLDEVNSLLDGNQPTVTRETPGATDRGARRGAPGARALASDHYARSLAAQRAAMARDGRPVVRDRHADYSSTAVARREKMFPNGGRLV